MAHKEEYKEGKGKKILELAMREIHKDIPSTVERANVSGKKKEEMLRAIAFSKARKAGAQLHKKRRIPTDTGYMMK